MTKRDIQAAVDLALAEADYQLFLAQRLLERMGSKATGKAGGKAKGKRSPRKALPSEEVRRIREEYQRRTGSTLGGGRERAAAFEGEKRGA